MLALAAGLLLFAHLICYAETMPFRTFTTKEGLADDRVNRIVRDSRGFLWFATAEGLSRFDSYEFKNYTQADGLPHRVINDLVELDDGTYLVATSNGLTVFNPNGEPNPKNNKQKSDPSLIFRTFRPEAANSNGKSSIILDLLKTHNGKIYAATLDGFYQLSPEENSDWKFQRIENDLWGSHSRLPEFVTALEDRHGIIWVGMANALFRYEPQNGKISLVSDGGVTSILEDRDGKIWVGGGSVEKRGINIYIYPQNSEQPVLTQIFTTENGLTSNEWINSLIQTSDGRILAVTPKSLCEFLPNAGAGELNFRSIVSGIDGVSLGEDAGSNVWIGTATLGAFKLARNGFSIFGESDGIPTNDIQSVFGGANGNEIFFSSGDHEILRFDGAKFTSVKASGMPPRGWGWSQIDLRSRIDGDWWLMTKEGVIRYPPVEKFEDLAKTAPKKIYRKTDGLFSDEVFRLWEDSRGNIWILSFGDIKDDDTYLHVWERASDKIRRYGKADGLPFLNNVTAFTENANGDIWLGFYAGGAARFHNGKFHFYAVQNGFPDGFVNAAYTDRKGRVWFGTSNSGVVRIDDPVTDEPHFISITVAEGLSSNRATCLTEDDFGRIYVGTGHGINRLDPDTGRVKLYTQADGLPYSAVEVCGRDKSGNLWFAQKNKLIRFTPQAEEKSIAPPIFIGELQVNGERAGKLSELGESTVENLSFDPEQRQIQIGFFAFGFGSGETLRYQYRLKGGNDEWSEPSPQKNVNLNLAPGTYDFEVRAVNSDGVTSESPARVSFSIARPVWQRWWFLMIAAFAVASIIYSLYRYRLKRLLELERVRTRIATDLHDDIGSSLSQIAILSEVVRQKVGAVEAASPLNMIADTSREMVDSMSDIVWAINPDKDHLADLAHRMRRFASEILEAQDIAYRFSFDEKYGKIALGADVRREVYMIFKESINNLVKHANARSVEITIRVENNSLTVEIKDDGKGFEPNEISNGNYEGFGGNGLINMRRRAKSLGGIFEIESRKNAGTNVTVKIPVR